MFCSCQFCTWALFFFWVIDLESLDFLLIRQFFVHNLLYLEREIPTEKKILLMKYNSDSYPSETSALAGA